MTDEEGGGTGKLRQKRTQKTGQLALGPRRAVCAERGPAWEAAEMGDREVGVGEWVQTVLNLTKNSRAMSSGEWNCPPAAQ